MQSGKRPISGELMITAGRIFRISAPTAGRNSTSQISPRRALLMFQRRLVFLRNQIGIITIYFFGADNLLRKNFSTDVWRQIHQIARGRRGIFSQCVHAGQYRFRLHFSQAARPFGNEFCRRHGLIVNPNGASASESFATWRRCRNKPAACRGLSDRGSENPFAAQTSQL